MSSATTPSPPLRPAPPQADEPQLPAGHCRYILLMPEIKGQRCGCAHFNLNVSTPGAICECGHLACYHLSNGEPPSISDNQELAMIRQRLEYLEREHAEFQQLRQEFHRFQQRIELDHNHQQEVVQEVVVRVSGMEDTMEKAKTEVSHEVREAYRNLGRAWDSITDLTHHKSLTEEHLRQIDDHLQSIDDEVSHIGDRQLELVDVDIGLEDRVETIEDRVDYLESIEDVDAADDSNNGAPRGRRPTSSTRSSAAHTSSRHATRRTAPPSSQQQQQQEQQQQQTSSPGGPHLAPTRPRSESPRSSLGTRAPRANMPELFAPALHNAIANAAAALHTQHVSTGAIDRGQPLLSTRPMPMPTFAPRSPAAIAAWPPVPPPSSARYSSGSASSSNLWTVHVSLLPTATGPFPFERGTTAYKRCLSRGLHQMVAVAGSSAEAFKQAIERAFGRALRGRRWAPLQALPCTAEGLAGLPMLRPLDASLIDEPCSLDFLRQHCAVLDSNGNIDSLYIAMRDKTLSWHSIRRLPVFLEGLEPCWNYDKLLDKNDVDDGGYLNDVNNSSEDEVMGGMTRPPAGDIVATLPYLKRAASQISRSNGSSGAAAAAPTATTAPANAAAAAASPEVEGGSRSSKAPRILSLSNMSSDVRRSVTTS